MQLTSFISSLTGLLLTSFTTPFPQLFMYFLLQFSLKKILKRKFLPEWGKRWLFVVSSLLTFLIIYVFVNLSNRNAADKSGAMIMVFPMFWTGLFIALIVVAEILIQIRRLLSHLIKR